MGNARKLDILPLTNSEILDILWDMHILHNRIWDDRNVPIRGDTASLVLALSFLSAFSYKELDIVRSQSCRHSPCWRSYALHRPRRVPALLGTASAALLLREI